ncbi:MAG: triose-phosphate isomerase [Thermoplasmata archaeon]
MTGTSTRSALAPRGPTPPLSTEGPSLGHPLFLLNLKAYPGHLGPAAVRIAKLLEAVGRETGVACAIAPPLPDLARVAEAVPIAVLAQHVDPGDAGARTGYVPVESIEAAGARGSLVNHSEHPMTIVDIEDTVRRLSARGLVAVVCAADVPRARRLAETHPPYLAVEPPELIGGDRAVSTARPEVVSGTVAAVRSVSPDTRVLCGAGVHDRRDVARALELGADGVLVASAVTRAPDAERAIRELLAGY